MNGYFADFVLYPSPVAGSLASGLSGVAGSSVVIAGSGFNTTGDTQVLFGASQSPNVTCTPTWCTATAPIVGSVAEGSVPDTVRLNGESTNAGYITYVLDCPNSTYSDTEPTPTVAGSAATFNVTCAPNTTGNPIWVYKLAGSAWQLAYGYTAASGSPPVPFMSSTVGSSGTFMSCFENSSVGLATPGESGGHLRGPRVLYRDDGTPPIHSMLHCWLRATEKLAGLEPEGCLHKLRHYADRRVMPMRSSTRVPRRAAGDAEAFPDAA